MKERVVVGLSGGVDSSVAALLLLQQGYEVHGVFMKNWDDSYDSGYCSAEDDLTDAEDVAKTLGIVLHKVNFVAEYQERVFAHFLAEYRSGRTPNPDVLCNTEIKFRAFLDHASRLGADWIATGHYARRFVNAAGVHELHKGVDDGKDQSYFLHGLDQAQLRPVLFPLGELRKTLVRELAENHDLITFDKKDSTGVCFIGERDFRAFLNQYIPSDPGPMVTPDGRVVGEHMGLSFYTLGQRRGLGIGGTGGDSGEPWFVYAKDLATNRLGVVQGDHPLLYSDSLQTDAATWISGAAPARRPFHCHAKTRYRQSDQACEVSLGERGQLRVVFEESQRAVTPGQSVVFYDAERCLGGAVINTVNPVSVEVSLDASH